MVAHDPQMPPCVKKETLLVAHYLQMPPSVKSGDITGSELSANAAIGENGTLLVAHYL